jgi:hypothetical protein
MLARMTADLRAEAVFIPRLTIAVLSFHVIERGLPESWTNFWAPFSVLLPLVLSIGATWLLVSVLSVRPRLEVTWYDLAGREIKGRVQTIEYSQERPVWLFELSVTYDQSGLARVFGYLLSRHYENVHITVEPEMATLAVERSGTGATKRVASGLVIPLIRKRNFYDLVQVSVRPIPSSAVVNVRLRPRVGCTHRTRWHETLVRKILSVDELRLVSATGESR